MARTLRPPSILGRGVTLPATITNHLPKLPDVNEPDVFEEMTLLEHMEELRDRIIKSVIAVGIAFIAGAVMAGPMLKRLQVAAGAVAGFDIVSPTDPITLYFRVALYIAVGLALPVILWQLVGFLLPGLTHREKRFLILSMPFVILLFLLGAAYGFFFAAPRALQFLSSFMSDLYEWSPEGEETISFFLTLMLGLGLAFQLPVVMFILAKLGIVSPQRMRSWWRYAVVILLVVAAVVTPSTDPFNMMIVFVPLYLLYEAGILVSRLFARTPLVVGDRYDVAP
ncbi:MAG: twin-arginine translocase subunit TatC [Thermomicrobiales bacterium]|nr:twin-arginine translocase subunit TatC [Thermomicrobiales bacterium]